MSDERLLLVLLAALVGVTGRLLWLDIRYFRKTQPMRVVLAGLMFCGALDALLTIYRAAPP